MKILATSQCFFHSIKAGKNSKLNQNSLKIQHIHNPTYKTTQIPTKMDFRFFGQPFVQAFGVPSRCQRYQQRCHCRPNRSNHPSYGAHGPWTMDQLLEEARRQVKAEQASGAIGDYFALLDSMLNGCHQRAQQLHHR